MPIKQKSIIKFGTGEIGVHAGISTNGDNGIIALVPQKPEPVGIKKKSPTIVPEEVHVVMEFSNIESLDVLIKQLNTVRKLMTGEMNVNDDT